MSEIFKHSAIIGHSNYFLAAVIGKPTSLEQHLDLLVQRIDKLVKEFVRNEAVGDTVPAALEFTAQICQDQLNVRSLKSAVDIRNAILSSEAWKHLKGYLAKRWAKVAPASLYSDKGVATRGQKQAQREFEFQFHEMGFYEFLEELKVLGSESTVAIR